MANEVPISCVCLRNFKMILSEDLPGLGDVAKVVRLQTGTADLLSVDFSVCCARSIFNKLLAIKVLCGG